LSHREIEEEAPVRTELPFDGCVETMRKIERNKRFDVTRLGFPRESLRNTGEDLRRHILLSSYPLLSMSDIFPVSFSSSSRWRKIENDHNEFGSWNKKRAPWGRPSHRAIFHLLRWTAATPFAYLYIFFVLLERLRWITLPCKTLRFFTLFPRTPTIDRISLLPE